MGNRQSGLSFPAIAQRVFLSAVVAGLLLMGCRTSRDIAEKPVLSDARVSYTVDATSPASGIFTVSLVPEKLPLSGDALFCIPSWAPGAYQFVEYGNYVRSLEAYSHDGERLTVIKLTTGTWKIPNSERLSKIVYTVTELQRRDLLWPEMTELTGLRGYANGTNIFGYLQGFTALPCRVNYLLPQGWQVASAAEDSSGSVTAFAENYDELADSPVIMGRFKRYDFTVLDKQHSIILDVDSLSSDGKTASKGSGNTSERGLKLGTGFRPDSLISVTKDIVLSHYKFFGELPYKKYLFIHRLVPLHIFSNYGALEHLQSSAYYMPLFDWHKARQNEIASTVSHEFFHVWNPKLIHSNLLGPFDYQNRIRTRNIWFIEGVTDYYSDLILVKAGVLPKETFFQNMLQRLEIQKVRDHEDKESLESLSLRIADIEHINEIFPFYLKGPAVMMMMDIELRHRTANRFGMDDLLLSLNNAYGKAGKSFPDDSLVIIISRLSGADITEFHRKFIAGTEPLPLNEYLAKAGLVLKRTSVLKPDMGYLVLPDTAGHFSIAYVTEGSAGEKIGLKEGDILLTINGIQSEEGDIFLQSLIEPEPETGKDTITFTVMR
ncbi:MAG: M61 family metallopeptidase, partial [Chlorobiales bacterium]|nr:M61 family metallopeptidase [Chlorobiales bacterium]